MKSCWIKVDPKSSDCCEDTGTQREDSQPGSFEPRNAKSCRQPPEARRKARKDPPLEPSEGVRPCCHLDFRLLASRTVREYISVVLNHLLCGVISYSSLRKLVQGGFDKCKVL